MCFVNCHVFGNLRTYVIRTKCTVSFQRAGVSNLVRGLTGSSLFGEGDNGCATTRIRSRSHQSHATKRKTAWRVASDFNLSVGSTAGFYLLGSSGAHSHASLFSWCSSRLYTFLRMNRTAIRARNNDDMRCRVVAMRHPSNPGCMNTFGGGDGGEETLGAKWHSVRQARQAHLDRFWIAKWMKIKLMRVHNGNPLSTIKTFNFAATLLWFSFCPVNRSPLQT